MTLNGITPEQILRAIQTVPSERWGEVLHVIESLQIPQSPDTPGKLPVRTGTDLQNSDLIGIWAGRTDLGNGHEFARELRRQAEQRDR